MNNFIILETQCEASFSRNRPFWHLMTNGFEMPVIFTSNEDFTLIMNLICLAALSIENVTVVAFCIMNNHLHVLLKGEFEACMAFFAFLKRRMQRCGLSIPDIFSADLREVDSLKYMRNAIAYIHRNAYVADSTYTPFNYPWSTCRYYFNPFPLPKTSLTYRECRHMFRTSDFRVPKECLVIDGYVAPPSYCNVELGMSMFRNAGQYFAESSKAVEGYKEMAELIGDWEFLTDAEVYAETWKLAKTLFSVNSLKSLNRNQKLELVPKMHYDLHASNGQIRRILYLSQYEVDSLLPLSSKGRNG